MAYTIAIASSDGVRIDQSFGMAEEFRLFRVEGTVITPAGSRRLQPAAACEPVIAEPKHGCGCGGAGGGHDRKAALLADCRCVLCRRIGPGARRQLERQKITVFDLEADVDETLQTVVQYFDKVDHHQSLR